MKPVTGLEYPHCVTVARQNYSAMAACNAAKHAGHALATSIVLFSLTLYVHAPSLK